MRKICIKDELNATYARLRRAFIYFGVIIGMRTEKCFTMFAKRIKP